MNAKFWIETVQRQLTIHPLPAGKTQASKHPLPTPGSKRQPVPHFLIGPPHPPSGPTDITVTGTQLQYTQRVVLDFNGLGWPHVSVATLVAPKPVVVPSRAFS